MLAVWYGMVYKSLMSHSTQ